MVLAIQGVTSDLFAVRHRRAALSVRLVSFDLLSPSFLCLRSSPISTTNNVPLSTAEHKASEASLASTDPAPNSFATAHEQHRAHPQQPRMLRPEGVQHTRVHALLSATSPKSFSPLRHAARMAASKTLEKPPPSLEPPVRGVDWGSSDSFAPFSRTVVLVRTYKPPCAEKRDANTQTG